MKNERFVSVPYEITLLSNSFDMYISKTDVSVPYEITLLSNAKVLITIVVAFQYLMKLHYSQTTLCQITYLFSFSTL